MEKWERKKNCNSWDFYSNTENETNDKRKKIKAQAFQSELHVSEKRDREFQEFVKEGWNQSVGTLSSEGQHRQPSIGRKSTERNPEQEDDIDEIEDR